MKKTILLFLIILFAINLFSQNRGFKPVEVKVSGNQITLYKQSHALVIGNSEYVYWNRLDGVKDDVQKVKVALEQNGFNVILKENLTKIQIITEIDNFISKYGYDKDNRVLIYYAGHGHTLINNNSKMGYIVPIDAPNPNTNERDFIAKSLPMTQFKTWSESSVFCKHSLFIFDACFAGSIFSSRGNPTANEIINYNTTNFVRQFIASGSANETVPDQSIFCTQFVYALQSDAADYNNDGYMTGTELGEYLRNTVIQYRKNRQHPQYGKLDNPSFDKGDFVFILNKSEVPEPEDIHTKTKGTIKLFTEITGKFYIDGVFYKKITANKSYTFANIETGARELKITGTHNWSEKVMITTKQTISIDATIEAKEKIIINSNPPNANIYLNGEFLGKSPQTAFLNYGTNTIKFNGVELYKETEHKLDIKKGGKTNYNFDLSPAGVRATINSQPNGANIKINNKFIGTTPFTTPLMFGNYQLKLSKSDYTDLNCNLNIIEGKTNYNFNLTSDKKLEYKMEYLKYKRKRNFNIFTMTGVAVVGLGFRFWANNLYNNEYHVATTEASSLHGKILTIDILAISLFTLSATMTIPIAISNKKQKNAKYKMNQY